MLEGQIARYEKGIAYEEKLARNAPTPDLALVHRQVALLYKSELAIIRSKRSVVVGEELANIW